MAEPDANTCSLAPIIWDRGKFPHSCGFCLLTKLIIRNEEYSKKPDPIQSTLEKAYSAHRRYFCIFYFHAVIICTRGFVLFNDN